MMTRYLVRHRVTGIYTSQDELVNDWRGLRQRTHAKAQWVRSWWSAPSSRLYCEWEAESEGEIRACFLPSELEMAPIEQVDEVVAIDPSWFDDSGASGGPSSAT
jgi:hypothetical protein